MEEKWFRLKCLKVIYQCELEINGQIWIKNSRSEFVEIWLMSFVWLRRFLM